MVEDKKIELVLEDDDLDRGEYAMTLFKIIKDYAPKGFDVVDDIELEPINRGKNEFSESTEEREKLAAEGGAPSASNSPILSSGVVYTSKLHHLDNSAFIMGISGAWGTGKTTFVKMFENLLQGKGILQKSQKVEEFINDNKFEKDEVVYFNSWLHDFYEDPMIPFSRILIEKVCGNNIDAYEEASKHFTDYLKKLRQSPLSLFAYEGKEETSEDDDLLPTDKMIKQLKSSLQQCMHKKSQKKVVIIVDELDRCKPTFAIQLLETVKHLFNVKGLVFIFSLDIGELKHCVKKVYGDDFEAIGYLERFFDYNSILPKGNDRKLMEKYVNEYELPQSVPEYYGLCRRFNLTPREMRGICSSFYYLNKYSLEGYPDKARLLYFYILLLKYKFPDDIQKLNSLDSTARIKLFGEDAIRPEFLTVDDDTFQPFFSAVINNKTLEVTQFYLIKGVDFGQKAICGEPRFIKKHEPLAVDSMDSWSFILYAKDFERGISDVLDRPVLEFLFNKVESYSNDIPMTKKSDLHRGSVINFGKWHKKTEEDMESIEWIVLDIEDDKALLISRYGIECLPYNTEKKPTTWAGSSLKEWLNNDFFKNAFSKEEKDMIAVSHVVAERNPIYMITNPGIDTDDKVFLLSRQEAAKYFPSDEARQCKPTTYAKKRGVDCIDDNFCWWWVCTPGNESHRAVRIDADGSLGTHGRRVDSSSAVRPCLRIKLQS